MTMQVSALAGMAVLLILVPANLVGEAVGKKVETRQMDLKDQRILLMNEILQGIKVGSGEVSGSLEPKVGRKGTVSENKCMCR